MDVASLVSSLLTAVAASAGPELSSAATGALQQLASPSNVGSAAPSGALVAAFAPATHLRGDEGGAALWRQVTSCLNIALFTQDIGLVLKAVHTLLSNLHQEAPSAEDAEKLRHLITTLGQASWSALMRP